MASGVLFGNLTQQLVLARGTTTIPLSSGSFLRDVQVQVGGDFNVDVAGDYIAEIVLRGVGSVVSVAYTVEVFNVTTAEILGSRVVNARSGGVQSPQTAVVPFTVVTVTDDLRVRVTIEGTNAQSLLTLLPPTLVATIQPIGSSQAFLNNEGACESATLAMPNQPVATNTVTIGADVYEFNGAGANINVAIGGAAADTRTNLITAINTQGTENVVADEIGTGVRIRSADAPGGNATGADTAIALGEMITDAADVWNVGNVNLNTLGGQVAPQFMGQSVIAITAAMITATFVRFDFPFTPVGFIVQVRAATGEILSVYTDQFTIANGGVLLTLLGMAGDIAATNVVTVQAWSA